MPHGRLSAVTAPHGMLATQALAGVSVPGAVTVREDVSTRIVVARKAMEDLMARRYGCSIVVPELSGGSALFEIGNSTTVVVERCAQAGIQAGINVGRWLGLAVKEFDASSSTVRLRPQSMLERFTDLLRLHARSLSPEHTKAFALQLQSLLANEDDFVEAHVQPSLASFGGLADLLRLNPNMRHPNLSIDDNGRFVASWAPHRRAKLSLTFGGMTGGSWVAADRSPDAKIRRSSGTFSVSDVGSIPDPFASWMSA